MKVLVACEFSGAVRRAFAARGHFAVSCDLLPAEDNAPFGKPRSPIGQHYQGDIFDFLGGAGAEPIQFDLMIAHPPCQYLCISGLHWNGRIRGRAKETEKALRFVRRLLETDIKRIALENPISCISTRIRKPDQTVQPWQFGHDASKATCFWLKNLPPLVQTKIVPPKGWKQVKFAAEMVEEEGQEAWCEECQQDFADCACYGPTQDGLQYASRNDVLFARPEDEPSKMLWANQTPSGQNKLSPGPDRWKDRSRTLQGMAEAMAEQWGRA